MAAGFVGVESTDEPKLSHDNIASRIMLKITENL